MVGADCFTCRNTADAAAPIRERILRTDHWRVAHAYDAVLPGWLVLVPTAHVQSLDELSAAAAAAELGPLLRELTAALIAVTGCVKTYVFLVAEQPGFAHLHFHVVPRARSMDDEHRGLRVFSLLGAGDDERVPVVEQDRLAQALHDLLATPPA